MQPTSLLNKAQEQNVCYEPFPHIVIREALPWDYYEKLVSQYPSLSDYKKTIPSDNKYMDEHLHTYSIDGIPENYRIDMSAKQLQTLGGRDTLVSFLKYHSGQEFYNSVVSLFRCSLSLYQLIVIATGHQLVGKCMAGINTPLTAPSTVRGPHTDSFDEFYSGLFYLKHPLDTSTGGDLNIYRVVTHRYPMMARKHAIAEDCLELVKTVAYEANTFLLFLNTPYAVHGVSVRQPSAYERRLIVLQADIKGIHHRLDTGFEIKEIGKM
ncbi:MAG: hypothetical protein ACREBU_07670 [Nitrososphaera sp.]